MSQTAIKLYTTKLIEISKGRKISIGGFRCKTAIEHLRDHLLDNEDRWCSTGCMASAMFGRNTTGNQAKIRRAVRSIFHELLDMGEFLAISYDAKNHGRIASIKIYQGLDDRERSSALLQLKRMLKRHQLTDELYRAAKNLIGVQEE